MADDRAASNGSSRDGGGNPIFTLVSKMEM
jgi:hypothetical protein